MDPFDIFVKFSGSLEELSEHISKLLRFVRIDEVTGQHFFTDGIDGYLLSKNPMDNDFGIDFESYEYILMIISNAEDQEKAVREVFGRLSSMGMETMLVDSLFEVMERFKPIEDPELDRLLNPSLYKNEPAPDRPQQEEPKD